MGMETVFWIPILLLAICWTSLTSRLRRLESQLRDKQRDDERARASTSELVAALTRRVWELEKAREPQPIPSPLEHSPPPLPAVPQTDEHTGEQPIAVVPPLPIEHAMPNEAMEPAAAAFQSTAAPAEKLTSQQQLESRMGLTWINRIGVITLIIGVAFFFKYAIDNQWIGETGRVVLGVAAGLIAVVAGGALWRRGQAIFAQGICGLGIGILYLSFYATFGFYHLLPQAAAFVLMALVTALAGALALRYSAMAIAALGMLGGYATPMLLSTGQDAPWTFFGYILLLNVGAVALARPRRWRPLDLLAFLATAVLYASWFVEWFRPEKRVVATLAALAFYALFTFVEWPWIFYAAQLLTGLGLAAMWRDAAPFLALSLLVGVAGLIISDLTRSSRVPKPLASSCSFAAFWGAYGLWQISHGKPEETITIFLLLSVAFVMYLMWTPLQLVVRRAPVRTPDLTIMVANGAAYFAATYFLLDAEYHAWLGLLAVALAAVHLLLGLGLRKEMDLRKEMEARKEIDSRNESDAPGDTRPAMLAFGLALSFLTLAVPIQFTGFTITFTWALEAAALVWIGRQMNDRRLWAAAAAVYLLVFTRLAIYDASVPVEQPLLNQRFATFAISAISFWLGAWWLKNAGGVLPNQSRHVVRLAAGVAYVTGHVVMLWVCLLEFGDWAALSVNPGDRHSVMAIGISLLMALYAVILIAIGVASRSALNRILGLGLIGFVVLKLYLYDVWEASRLFRTAAFVALGLLLLLTSYLYSRLRPKIESWLKDEEAAKLDGRR